MAIERRARRGRREILERFFSAPPGLCVERDLFTSSEGAGGRCLEGPARVACRRGHFSANVVRCLHCEFRNVSLREADANPAHHDVGDLTAVSKNGTEHDGAFNARSTLRDSDVDVVSSGWRSDVARRANRERQPHWCSLPGGASDETGHVDRNGAHAAD